MATGKSSRTLPSSANILKPVSDEQALARVIDTALENRGFHVQRVLQGPKGLKGDKGDRGEKGETGEEGPRGEQGPRGLEGAPGPRGEVGLPGERGPQGEEGPQGPRGPVGEPGPQGLPGEQGPPPKHEINHREFKIRFEEAPGVWGEWIDLKHITVNRVGGGGGGVSAPAGSDVTTDHENDSQLHHKLSDLTITRTDGLASQLDWANGDSEVINRDGDDVVTDIVGNVWTKTYNRDADGFIETVVYTLT